MPHGLRIKKSNGTVMLDVSDRITRLRYSNEVAANASGNTTLDDIANSLSVEFSVLVSGEGGIKAPHNCSRNGTVFSWTASSGEFYVSWNSLIFLFLYT